MLIEGSDREGGPPSGPEARREQTVRPNDDQQDTGEGGHQESSSRTVSWRSCEKGGFIVKNPSREEIEETFGIRAVLEGYAAALATRNMDHDDSEETGGDPGMVQGCAEPAGYRQDDAAERSA